MFYWFKSVDFLLYILYINEYGRCCPEHRYRFAALTAARMDHILWIIIFRGDRVLIMKEKIQKKRSQKGFTLVELVIVIAILAILAAIAIPVITTTINSAKYSILESDGKTVEMVFKDALATYKTNLNVTYNSKTPKTATLGDVLAENNIEPKVMSVRKINGIDYCLGWNNMTEGIVINSGSAASAIDLTWNISSLDK